MSKLEFSNVRVAHTCVQNILLTDTQNDPPSSSLVSVSLQLLLLKFKCNTTPHCCQNVNVCALHAH